MGVIAARSIRERESFDLSDALRDRIKARRVARISANLAVTDGAFTIDHADGTPAEAF